MCAKKLGVMHKLGRQSFVIFYPSQFFKTKKSLISVIDKWLSSSSSRLPMRFMDDPDMDYSELLYVLKNEITTP